MKKPMDDDIENVGIMQGFMDSMGDDGEAESENEDEGMSMPEMERSPRSPEILMNNLRGDMRSVDARRDELPTSWATRPPLRPPKQCSRCCSQCWHSRVRRLLVDWAGCPNHSPWPKALRPRCRQVASALRWVAPCPRAGLLAR